MEKNKLPTKNKIIIFAISIVVIAFLCVGGIYIVKRKTFEDVVEATATYTGNAKFDPQKGIIMQKENEDGTFSDVSIEEIFEEIKDAEKYLKDDENSTKEEKLQYLINAQLVTQYPYIQSLEEDETKLNGIIKFFRYTKKIEPEETEENQSYQMIYTTEEELDKMIIECENTGNMDVFKYFTLNDKNEIVVATWSKTIINISTDDPVVTTTSLSKFYKQDFSKVEQGKFTSDDISITKKPLIEMTKLVEQYSMPFDLLWAFMVTTESYDFVKEFADLAYETEIHVGIYDNETKSERYDTETYSKSIRYTENTNLIFPENNTLNTNNVIKNCYGAIEEDEAEENYTAVHTNNLKETEQGTITYHYITGATSEGVINSLGEQEKEYWKKTSKSEVSAKSPTIGVSYVSNWLAKWQVNYKEVTEEPISDGLSDTIEAEEYQSIPREQISVALTGNSGLMGTTLTNHSKKIKQKAIDKIVQNKGSSFGTNVQVTKEAIHNHLDGTDSKCKICLKQIEQAYEKTYEEIKKQETLRQSVLSDIIVAGYNAEDNYQKKIYTHVYQEQSAKNAAQKEAFIEDLNKNINYEQWPTAEIANVNLQYSKYYAKTPKYYDYDKDEISIADEGIKFKEIVDNPKYYKSRKAILELAEWAWFWEYIRASEETKELEDYIRIMFNIAFETDKFGDFDEDEIRKVLLRLAPKKIVKAISTASSLSPFGCTMTKEEFLEKARSYAPNSILVSIAEDFYDVCTMPEYNINPCLAYVWAAIESGFGASAPYNNLFGMGIGNGMSSGERYETYADSIEDYCRWIVDAVDPSSDMYEWICTKAEEFVTVNSKFVGTPEENIYVLFCTYGYLGNTHIVDELDSYSSENERLNYYKNNGSTYGAGGRIQIYNMYEHGIYEGEYEERCTHKYGSDETTLQEKADYAEYVLFCRFDLAQKIFGDNAFLGSGIIAAADEVHNEEITWIYYTDHPLELNSLTWGDIETSINNPYETTCCATYVSCVLYRAGYFTEAEMNAFNYNSPDFLDMVLKERGWERIEDDNEFQAGDIVIMDKISTEGKIDHVQIYAGDNTWYNAGYTGAIQGPAPYESIDWALRFDNCWAYRPPNG